MAQALPPLQPLLDEITEIARASHDRGKVADYIPELADVDLNQFGIAIARPGLSTVMAGDAQVPFSIQSVSKVFMLALALGKLGDRLWSRVGREPSGHSFDSMLLLELEKGYPRNPFINAGAIVTTDAVLQGSSPRETLGALLRFIRAAAGDEAIHINDRVARSEIATGHRNFALAPPIQGRAQPRHDLGPLRVADQFLHLIQQQERGPLGIGKPIKMLIQQQQFIRRARALALAKVDLDPRQPLERAKPDLDRRRLRPSQQALRETLRAQREITGIKQQRQRRGTGLPETGIEHAVPIDLCRHMPQIALQKLGLAGAARPKEPERWGWPLRQRHKHAVGKVTP